MPGDENWRLTHLDVPEAQWKLPRTISSARLVIESDLSISAEEGDEKTYSVDSNTRVEFVSPEDSSKIYGFIHLRSNAVFSYNLTLDELKEQTESFKKFVSEASAILAGTSRTEVRRIASMAGLHTPVLIPTQYIDGLE